MPLTKAQRQEIVEDLTTNCDCWKAEGSAETLNALGDDQLLALGRQHAITQKATTGFKLKTGDGFRVNAATGEWEAKRAAPLEPGKKRGKGAAPAANAGKYPEEEDEEEAVEEDEDEEEMLKKNRRRVMGKGDKTKTPPAQNAFRRPRTEEEFLDIAPESIVATVRNYRQWEAGEKEKLVHRIAANAAEDERPARTEWLRGQSLEVLQNMANLLPAAEARKPARAGAAAPATNAGEDDPEILEIPTLNFGDDGDPGKARQEARAAAAPYFEGASEEEALASLPVSVQNTVREARKIEQREREGLVEQLTANMDPDEADAFAAKWSHRPLADLRDLLKLAPQRSAAAARYFGPGAPLGNRGYGVSTNLAGADDELLPLPTMNFSDEDGAGTKKRKQA